MARGVAYWLPAGSTQQLANGEVLVIAPGVAGRVRASQLDEVLIQTFTFDPERLGGLLSLSERHCFQTLSAKAKLRLLPSTHPVSKQFAEVASGVENSSGLKLRASLLALVALAFDEELLHYSPPPASATSALSQFRELVSKMPDLELVHHAPGDLARLCHCSPRHFSRMFLQHFGVSVRARQTELRLLKAGELLLETDAKIVHIALESGYTNLSLFNTMFKRRYGMTPSAWRSKGSGRPAKGVRTASA